MKRTPFFWCDSKKTVIWAYKKNGHDNSFLFSKKSHRWYCKESFQLFSTSVKHKINRKTVIRTSFFWCEFQKKRSCRHIKKTVMTTVFYSERNPIDDIAKILVSWFLRAQSIKWIEKRSKGHLFFDVIFHTIESIPRVFVWVTKIFWKKIYVKFSLCQGSMMFLFL